MCIAQAPTRINKFLDACTCGRADKAALGALKKELEKKDGDIERLEEEIRRKDTEKDNLIHMQKDLQSQIEEIRVLLESHAADAQAGGSTGGVEMDDEKAAALMQRRARGLTGRKKAAAKKREKEALVKVQARTRGALDRKKVGQKSAEGVLPGQQRLEVEKQENVAVKLQARQRGLHDRKMVEQQKAEGVLPGQQRMQGGAADADADADADGGPYAPAPALDGGDYGEGDEGGLGFSEGASSYFDEDEQSVDSDYDYEESAFEGAGAELLAGKLKLAKVYGQEEPPAAEDELEWEVRYFVLYDGGRIVHHDDLQEGVPVGDRGLIELGAISAVEKVLGVNTFVMKGQNKVYLFKLETEDEVMMRTWINAISQELAKGA